MDNILQGSSGKRYRIQTPALAKGGEGSIFKINGEAQIVAKIFDEKKRTFERTEKLIQMVTVTEQGRLKEFAAWPMDLLYGEKRIVGYVMRNLEEYQDLNQACSGGIPGITFFRKILIAQNLCAAVTIHKSQGSEYPAVVIPLLTGPRMLMNRNLLYTAVTRARSCVTLVGSEETFQMMIANGSEQARYSGLLGRIQEVERIES